ncbi:AlpA family phage regulatory protein [Pseudomonas syringae pv. actinidiae]|uniref:helix-turn-helix transcriptional regulator n=1 Tax=Pseudomonas syringae TaxID=317 RepID=UPI0003580C72|nr:AlpA family phage regulatory protein [Pseudomonas syringae]EPN65894.1 prophage CP4-57 regulatory protein [Pseudomonas syringae pv. actinidiae ICMP 19101]EPN72688.1 prophage CP4-57 regulatory protein [Pseudomonas syringae pv. actinidiae ICMP 19079]AKT29254.1 AlpA family transcriptional regulator [Pseudomonas syringae pv. actinidiae ICMP 18884]AQX58021.1 AlpA family phage regulatory protein [Pseudomonas syringae pv. actinidiae]AQX63916.1 AlpA family phage regulatory protein [Pseudomonas syrin
MANTTNPPSPARRFIKRQEVESITGLSCTEIYRRVAADNFPKQVTLGPKSVVWVETEILAWCRRQL